MNHQDSEFFESVEQEIYSVSELNSETRELIEGSFPLIWVEGEISNFARPASGHWYFTLKDEAAQVRCAMFRMRNRLIRFTPSNGMQVLVRAQVSLYEARGEFQLIAEHMEEAGAGALRRRFDALKHKLAEEGLFDEERKQPIPEVPLCIGVITSPSGAAIRDVLSVLQRRFPLIPVVVYPVPVQGDGAAQQIARLIKRVNQRKECDVVILCRGGGSLEDLWSFNEEVVARAIDKSRIPIVCGVGHEIDFTIADFVADLRAPTPSAAAELITPNQQEWLDLLKGLQNRLTSLTKQALIGQQQRLQWLGKRLQHPRQRLLAQAQRLDELEQRLTKATDHYLRHARAALGALHARLLHYSPAQQVRELELQRAGQTLNGCNAPQPDIAPTPLAGGDPHPGNCQPTGHTQPRLCYC
jgi:exodeoxyribonuclease VII large subunit